MPSPPTSPATPPRRRHPSSPRRPSQRAVLIVFAALCTVALTIFAVRSSARNATNAPSGSDAQLDRGRTVYATRCASCHGAALQGEIGWPEPRANGTMPAPPLGERGNAWRQTDQWIFTTIKQGGQVNAAPGQVSTMPAFAGGLPDDDIWAVVAYIKSTWPSQLREAQPK